MWSQLAPASALAIRAGVRGVTSSAPVIGSVLVLAGMYHRIDRDELFDNPVRRRLYDAVKALPGRTLTAYGRDVGVDRTTARYHLAILASFDMVRCRRLRGRRRWFENHGRFDRFAMEILAELWTPSTRRIVEEVWTDPGIHNAELARRVGLSESAVYRRIRRLETIGAVRRERDGRRATVRPAPERREEVDALRRRVAEAQDDGDAASA